MDKKVVKIAHETIKAFEEGGLIRIDGDTIQFVKGGRFKIVAPDHDGAVWVKQEGK